jgi:uncharacterized protein (DUF2225 family)
MASKKTAPTDKQKTYSLLVWHEFPENLHMYLLPNEVADKYRETLEGAQGHFVNTDSQNDAVMALNQLVYPVAGAKKAEKAVWQQYQLLQDVIKGVTITYVYTTGMAL